MSITLRRYSIEFLLTRRDHATKPEGLEAAILIVKELNVERPFVPVPYRESRGRGRGRDRGRGRGSAYRDRNSRIDRHVPTRLPVKTGRSALTLLLNKLGDDNVDMVSKSVAETFETTEDLSSLVKWFMDTTMPQVALAATFANMWKAVFHLCPAVKLRYMALCKEKFEGLKYDGTEADDALIVQLAETLVALHCVQAISLIPITHLLVTYVGNLHLAAACSRGLDTILAAVPEARRYLEQHAKSLDKQKRDDIARLLNDDLATEGKNLPVNIVLAEALSVAGVTFPTFATPPELPNRYVVFAQRVSMNPADFCCAPKVKFRFLDFLDLRKRAWVPRKGR